MDTSATPHQDATETDDSGCFTGSFQNSKITFESTPNSTPTSSLDLSSRKRKATSFLVPPSSSLINIPENCPIFSSTLNESILNNLEKCQISPEVYSSGIDDDSVEKPVKYVKLNSTPVKENKTQNVAYCNKSSPYRKEAIDILYPSKPVIPRKLLTPQKYGSSGSSVDSSGGVKKRIFSPAKKRLFEPVIRVDPMKYFKGNSIILGKIFANLSDGDLYRVSMVSKEWKRALGYDRKVFNRYQNFVGKHKVNKENYSITPPDSPPSPDSPAVSPGSRQFYAFYKLGMTLAPDQTLTKCPICSKPAIIDKDISQCQNLNCGYIYCTICSSFSTTGPEDFHNKCQRSHLLIEKKEKPRRLSRLSLADLSNSSFDLDQASFLPGLSRTTDTSGYVSETESPLQNVKRNLNKCLTRKVNVLTVNNNRTTTLKPRTKKIKPILIPVVRNENVIDARKSPTPSPPSSPPKKKNIAGSKQSKKNLRRLLL